MTPQECAEYVRLNRGSMPIDKLKQALIGMGASPKVADEAIFSLLADPEMPLAPSVPPAPLSAAPAAPASGTPPAAQLAPAQSAGSVGFLGLVDRDLKVFVNPREFFRAMPRTGGFRQPMVFAGCMILAGAVLRLVLLMVPYLYRHNVTLPVVSMLVGASVGLGLGAILSPFLLFIGAGVMHVIWLLLGSKQRYEVSFRCVAYCCFLWPISSIAWYVPVVSNVPGVAVGLIWLYLQVMISKEVHEIAEEKAWPAFGALFFISFIAPLALQLANVGSRQRIVRATASPEIGRYNPASVKVKDLIAFIPKAAAGMTMVEFKGREAPAKMSGMAVAYAKYKNSAGGQLEISIKDLTGMGRMAAMIHTTLTSKTDRKTQRGYTRSIIVGKYSGLEVYDDQLKSGRIELAVGPRYVVQVQGTRIAIEPIREFLKQVDLSKLEGLRPAAAPSFR